MKKKLISLLLCSVMVISTLVGCGKEAAEKNAEQQSTEQKTAEGETAEQETAKQNDGQDVQEELVTIKYVVPGNAPDDYEKVIGLVNEKMAQDINVNISVEYIPWDVWDQKINLKLSTQEPFDLFQIMQGRYDYQRYIADGALTDITDIVDEYGKDILANIPDEMINTAKTTDGKLYIVPTYWYEPATAETCLLIRKDIRTKYGFELPATPKELADQIIEVAKEWEGNATPYIPMDSGALQSGGNAWHRAYDRYPFYVKDNLTIFYTDDSSVGSWIESDEFRQDAEFYEYCYKNGVISPDVLTITQTQSNAAVMAGDWYAMYGTSVDIESAGLTEDDIEVLYFSEDKEFLRPFSIKNSNAVPFTSEHPEAAVKFLNWLYGDQENYDLFMYGIEGEHYTVMADHQIEPIVNPDTGAVGYSFADWMVGNINRIKYNPTKISQKVCEVLYTPKTDATNHPADGFTFDASSVQSEYADVITAIDSYIAPIYAGVLNYEKEFPAALDKVKAAGLDKVIEEYRKQYEEFIGQ